MSALSAFYLFPSPTGPMQRQRRRRLAVLEWATARRSRVTRSRWWHDVVICVRCASHNTVFELAQRFDRSYRSVEKATLQFACAIDEELGLIKAMLTDADE